MNVIIIEDEELSASRLERMILHCDAKINILAKIESVADSVEWLLENPAPDLIFLDIHLEDGLSFSIFEKVSVESAIVFTTAFDEYAIKAFKLKSIDYLLKPIVQQDLNNAIKKYNSFAGLGKKDRLIDIAELMDIIQIKSAPLLKNYKKRFSVQIGQKIKAVSIDEIAYFCSEEGITYFITALKQKYTLDDCLDAIETDLDPEEFFRASRSFLIKITAIQNVMLYPKSRLKLELNPPSSKEIFVSSERSKSFRQWLNK